MKRGKIHGSRKYTRDDAIEWRRIMREERISQNRLAKKLGISYDTVNRVMAEFGE